MRFERAQRTDVQRVGRADRALLDRFERAQAEGDLPAGVEPQALACYLSTVIQGMAVQAGAGVPRDRLEQLIDTTLTMWPSK